MSHFFYEYKVYMDDEGVEWTLLKWLVDGTFGESSKIDKPTSDLTDEDLIIIQHFIDDGMIIREKIEAEIPPSDSSDTNMNI